MIVRLIGAKPGLTLSLGGERVATLTASERAVPLYRRLGFVPLGRAVHWAAAPDGRSGTRLDQ